jgi:hypothetical protein
MSHTLPSWIEHLLGIDAPSGEGTVWSFEYAWPWPPWLTLLFAVFAATFVVVVYLRERPRSSPRYRMGLAGVRLALMAIALLMISQLALSLKRTGLPYVAVLIDDTLSMNIVDHYGETLQKNMAERAKEATGSQQDLSRWTLARTLLTEDDGGMFRRLADEHRLRVYFLSGLRATGRQDAAELVKEIQATAPSGESTPLGGAVLDVLDDLRGTAPAAIVVLSDGINTDGPTLSEAAQSARNRGVPLFLIGLGSEQAAPGLKLSDLLVDDVVFVDDLVNFECRLTAAGFQGRKLNVLLREKGKPNVLAKVEVTAGPDGQPQQIRLPYRPTQAGPFEYVVAAEPQEANGARNAQNNQLSRKVQVRKEKIRVLLVQGYPNFEFRYLRNLLERDATVALNTVLQEADLEHAEQDASALRVFPVRREELFAYDVVICGDVDPSLLSASALQNLADFVDQPGKGGALLLLAGPKYMPAAYRDTPLARLMPFDPASVRYPDLTQTLKEGFTVQPTELGLASPSMQLGDSPEETQALWRRLPPLYWLLEVPRTKPGVRVLAEASNPLAADGRRLPVICLQYVGAGKVLFHATDETWRWRWRAGERFFARYWVQTIRYLCRAKLSDSNQPVTLATDRREYARGEPIWLRANFADERLAPPEDDGVAVVVEQAGQKTQRLQLHRTSTARGGFEGVLSRIAAGSYHAWIAVPTIQGGAPAVDFSVAPPAGEFTQVRMDAVEMRQAARQTGGQFYTFETAGQLSDDLPPGRQVPVESLPPHPLWNRWPLLAVFLALLIGEWILRKRKDMV